MRSQPAGGRAAPRVAEAFLTGPRGELVLTPLFTLPYNLARVMTGRVLVLNASFEPINVCSERRAVVMIFKGVARMEEHNGHMLHSAKITMHAPSVIRLTEYIHIPFKNRTLSRKNILLRDHSTCQYCGRALPASELTLDHVLPRSRGGESTWDNLVACCKRCNHRKGSRTPEEAHMHLVRRPRGFSLHVNRQIMRYLGRADEAWRKYLFYESDNGEG